MRHNSHCIGVLRISPEICPFGRFDDKNSWDGDPDMAVDPPSPYHLLRDVFLLETYILNCGNLTDSGIWRTQKNTDNQIANIFTQAYFATDIP